MKYQVAVEVNEIVLRERKKYGEQYQPDVIRTAALAAAEVSGYEREIDAIEFAFIRARWVNHVWDGSIA